MALMYSRWAILVSAVVCSGCASPPPVVPPPVPSAAPPATVAVAPEPPPPAPPPPPPPDTRVHDACAKLCERVKVDCGAARAETCAAQCVEYEAKPPGCEADAAAAFTCQTGAPETFCHNVVASTCVDAFGRLMGCYRGEARPAEAKAAELPAGWEKVTDATWNVSLTMPKGAAVDSSAKSRTWRATADGATYEVVELPRPTGKLDDRAFIRLLIAHLGANCQVGMKLGGRVEEAGHTFMRFETGCGKKERVFGKIYVDQAHAISMVVRGEANEGRREAFLDSVLTP
jgi:hypothetical protein